MTTEACPVLQVEHGSAPTPDAGIRVGNGAGPIGSYGYNLGNLLHTTFILV